MNNHSHRGIVLWMLLKKSFGLTDHEFEELLIPVLGPLPWMVYHQDSSTFQISDKRIRDVLFKLYHLPGDSVPFWKAYLKARKDLPHDDQETAFSVQAAAD